MFDRRAYDKALVAVASHYMTSAPTVSGWCDCMSSANDAHVSLADLHLLKQLVDAIGTSDQVPPNLAANMVYHLQDRMGRGTVGMLGF